MMKIIIDTVRCYMKNKKPPFEITNQMIDQVAEIAELVGKYLLPFRFPSIRLYAAVTVSAPFTGLWQLSRIRFLWNR